jgi:hypothetical protein
MMTLRNAITFLRGAVARSMPGGLPSTYIFHEGTAYAQNSALLAAYPVPHILGTFALAADDIEGALGRMDGEPAIEAGNGTIILRAGRLRSSIQLLAVEPPGHDIEEDRSNAPWEPPPPRLMEALRLATPFVPREGTWQRSVLLTQGRALAVSDRHAVAFDVPGLEPITDAPLPAESVEFLSKIETPASWRLTAGSVSFSWESGAWARCQLLAIRWPDVIDQIFERAGGEAPVELTDEWRASFADVAALGDGSALITPYGMIGTSEHAEHQAEFETGLVAESRWSIAALKPVFACAERWNPAHEAAARFEGKGLHGVVARMRR